MLNGIRDTTQRDLCLLYGGLNISLEGEGVQYGTEGIVASGPSSPGFKSWLRSFFHKIIMFAVLLKSTLPIQ